MPGGAYVSTLPSPGSPAGPNDQAVLYAAENASDRMTLYEWVDPGSGSSTPVLITDQQVDNVHNTTGSGMRAHNYWDNVPQFVQPLAETLRSIATAAEPSVQNVDRGSEARTPAS